MATELQTTVFRIRGAAATTTEDWLAVERPLEIRARTADGHQRVVSTTMRTPGEDRALVAGFLVSERVIKHSREIRLVESLDDDTVLIELGPEAETALAATQRPFLTTGACGVCGRTSLDALLEVGESVPTGQAPRISANIVHRLPSALRTAQAAFARTGGLHAAGLFTMDGRPQAVHEDVGRHNAVDKLVGTLLLAGQLPACDGVLVVSGRASFELVQKAAIAEIPVMVAVGAPSSLAVQIARQAGMTLLGFVRDDGFNAYCGADRLSGIDAASVAEVAGSRG